MTIPDWVRPPSVLAGVLKVSLISLCAAAAFTATAAAQASEDMSLPLLPATEAQVRAELLESVRQVQNQLAATPENPQNEARITALRTELEALMLQAEVEKLQRGNAVLKTQLDVDTPEPAAPTEEALSRRVEALTQEQRELSGKLEVMSEQHAEMQAQKLRDEQAAQKLAEQAEQMTPATKVASTTPNVPDTALASALSSGSQVYTVRSGDSLSKLAAAYYGSVNRWPEILAANPWIDDPDMLLIGKKLTLP